MALETLEREPPRRPAAEPPKLDSHAVIALQRTAGNAAVASLLARKGKTVAERQTELERGQRILRKRQDVSDQDARWRARIMARLASRTQAAARFASAYNTARDGFQGAQSAQAQANAVELQFVGAAFAVGFAFTFEWMFTAVRGTKGILSDSAEKMLELVENPANAAVSGGINVLGAKAGKDGAPTPTGGAISTGHPLTHLSRSIEAIAASQQALEEAFLNRRKGFDELSEDEWEHLDLAAQEMIYGKLLAEIEGAGSGVEKLKDEATLAVVLERHLWALWLKSNIVMQAPGLGIGGEIEDRLTKIGVAGLAGVDLTPWLFNEPDDWKAMLLSWARAFNHRIYND